MRPKPYKSPLRAPTPARAAPEPPARVPDPGLPQRGDFIGRRWEPEPSIPVPALCPRCHMDTVHQPGCEMEQAERALAEDPTLGEPEPPEPQPLSAQLTGLLGDALVRFGELLRDRARRDDDRL